LKPSRGKGREFLISGATAEGKLFLHGIFFFLGEAVGEGVFQKGKRYGPPYILDAFKSPSAQGASFGASLPSVAILI